LALQKNILDMRDQIEKLRKKIIYRSHKRGFLETELILENFIKQFLMKMNYKELEMLDFMLSHDDPQIIEWLYNNKLPPQNLKQLLQHLHETIIS
jgi:succinate dehydrogenase flavin-adding protein (antitoxin of CptAB toxin-antitoxin module)